MCYFQDCGYLRIRKIRIAKQQEIPGAWFQLEQGNAHSLLFQSSSNMAAVKYLAEDELVKSLPKTTASANASWTQRNE